MKLSSARTLEEEITGAIYIAKKTLATYKRMKLSKEDIRDKERELKKLKEVKRDIHKEIEKIFSHEIKVKSNKEQREWLRKHPGKKLIDYLEQVVTPRMEKKLKKHRL